jgi:uncharacterized protein (DUF302 family)
MFFIGLLSGIVIFGLCLAFIIPKMLFSVNESKYDFDRTVDIFTESTKNRDWKMPYQYDLQQIMANNGFEVEPVKVFSICKPDIAVRLLNNDHDRHIAAIMPCRIAIYKDTNGKTYISRMNAGLISKLLGGKASIVMGVAGDGSEYILKSVVK